MITAHQPNQNRLLELDQSLLGWKQSPQDWGFGGLDAEIVDSSDRFSYQGIADRLESRKSLGYGSIHQRLRSAAVEDDVEPEDDRFAPSFFGESPAATTELLDKEESSTFSTPSDWQQAFIPEAFIPEATPFSLPEIELPDDDFADSMVAGSEDFSSEDFSSEDFPHGNTSYSALYQSIQAARQGNPPGFDDEEFTITATKPTIDIAAQTIN
jgi:hypothetical protein